jgi:hypothetical protein
LSIQGFHHFVDSLNFLVFALLHSLCIDVCRHKDIITTSEELWLLTFQELWHDPWLPFGFGQSPLDQDLLGISWLRLLCVIDVIPEHDIEKESENLSDVFNIWEQEHVESELVVIVKSLHVLGQLLANSEFV